MDRRHLEYFVAIAELGSFTRAAQSLSIAQPSLSYAIGWLERDLGAQLFERHGRGVRLTPAGEALLEPARRSLPSFPPPPGALDAVRLGGAELGLLDGTPPGEVLTGRWVADHEFVAVLPPGPEPVLPAISI